MAIGENVKRYRQKIGFTQKQLADLCGVSHTRISELENGHSNPTVETLRIIAERLETSIEKLIAVPKSRAS